MTDGNNLEPSPGHGDNSRSSTGMRFQVGMEVAPGRVYVVRKEDHRFAHAIRNYDWTNLVAARTMGKSSMFDRTGRQLEHEGFIFARADLAQVGLGTSEGLEIEDPLDLFKRIEIAWANVFRNRRGMVVSAEEITAEFAKVRANLQHEPDGTRVWHLLEYFATRVFESHPSSRLVLGIDEIQLLSEAKCGTRFVEAMRGLAQEIGDSRWHDKIVFCFVGWEPFGDFSRDVRGMAMQIVQAHNLHDFAPDDDTIATLATAFANPADAIDAVRETLHQTGGQPYLTCAALNEIKNASEFVRPEKRDYLEVVREFTQNQWAELRGLVGLLISHTKDELLNFEDAWAAMQVYQRLLNRPDRRMPSKVLGGTGLDTLCRVGLARRANTLDGEVGEIKSPIFASWFDHSWANGVKDRSSANPIHQPTSTDDGAICLILVGGTVCMNRPRGGERTEFADKGTIRDFLLKPRPAGRKPALPRIDIQPFDALDSINVHPIHWKPLIQLIAAKLRMTEDDKPVYSGIVVAHGTDTLSFTASAVAFALHEVVDRPIVFTGSQVPLDAFDSDGPPNLYTACQVARKGRELPEVVVVFGRRVLRAVQSVKRHDFEYEGFWSPMSPELGVVSETVDLYPNRIIKRKPQPGSSTIHADFAEKVLLVELMPGLEPDLYFDMLDNDLSGIILQTLGAGNVSDEPGFDFTEFVEIAWHKKTIPVLVTSKIPVDSRTYTRYERGVKAIDRGAVPAMNMTASAAAAKFRWILANTQVAEYLRQAPNQAGDDVNHREAVRKTIWELMRRPFVGEIASESDLNEAWKTQEVSSPDDPRTLRDRTRHSDTI